MSPAPPFSPSRRASVRRGASAAPLVLALLLAGLPGAQRARSAPAGDAVPLPFHRVHVPAGRIDEVRLGPDRLVPLPLAEFEEALRAAGAGAVAAPPIGLLQEARYRAVLGSDGRFDGTVACDVEGRAAESAIDLGGLPADGAAASAADGPVPILLHGDAGGRLAASVTRPARCTFHWMLEPDGQAGWYELPLLPAARALVDLVLPAGLWPAVEGNRLVRQAESGVSAAGGDAEGAAPTVTWRVEAGPVPALRFRVVPLREGTRSIACHQTATVGLGQIQLAATLVPATPWRSRELVVDADPRLVVERVAAADADGAADRPDGRDARRLRIALPPEILGTITPVTLRAAARSGAGDAAAEWLPLVWPEAPDWGGGGVRVACEAGLSLADVEIEQAVAVDAGTAAGWAAPPAAGAGDTAGVAVEAQGPGARVRVAVLPAAAELDVARVTTVEVAAAGVTARAECDVRVKRGAAYDIGGRVAAGWFIDAVEALEEEAGGEAGARGPTAAAPPVPIEWRVVRDGRGAQLRIGLPVAVTPERGLRLRIAGHRAGVDFDVPFACRDLDMVRLEGETDDGAVMALSSPPETAIELEREAPVPERPAPRLAALLPAAAVRAWIPADGGAMAGSALLLERRAAVEGSTAVVLTCRDDRIVQAFTFTCRPGGAPLDAVVVHFSEPTDDLLEWTLLPPADAALSVRRVAERGGTARGGETWLVEFQPPLRRETGLRATRAVPFNGPVAVPLAWIDGSGREDGSLAVVNAGRRRPLFLNRRLAELPPGAVGAAGVLAEFAYDSGAADPAGPPAAEIVPGGRDRDEDARAWAWGESSTCWIHPTGVTEYETVFEIENHGRGSVSLAPPATLIPRGVAIDGVPAPASRVPETGALVVDLPAGRRFVRLAVRSEADIRPGRAGWRVPLATTGIDVPVLERTWQALVPDGVDLVGASPGLREVVAEVPGWVERLLPVSVRRRGTSPRDGAAAPRRGTIDAGFRARTFVLPSGGVAAPSVLLVRSRWTWAATLLVCLGAATFGLGVRRRLTRLAVAVALAVLALWLPGPLDGLARAGLWGLAAAALVRFGAGRWPRLLPVLLAVALLSGRASAQALPDTGGMPAVPESLPVFIVPDAGADGAASSTALVPEPLFRALAMAAGRRAGDGVRFLAARLEAAPGTALPWKLVVEVEATGGSLLSLTQAHDGTWGAPGPSVDGVAVRPSPDSGARIVRVGFPAAGRHRVELPLAVVPRREGDVVTATVELPVTPHTDVVVEGPLAPARGAPTLVQAERIDGAGRPRALATAARDTAPATVFDASRAALVRLSWAADGRTTLADAVPAAESRNVIAWRDGGGRLEASFRVDGRGQIVRGVVVRAEGRLGPMTLADPDLTSTALAGNRFLVAPRAPRRGGFQFDAAFELQPDDPVGAGDLPGAWIESAGSDARSVRVEAPAELVVRVTPPDDALRAPQQAAAAGTAGGEETFEWRLERGGGARQVDVEDAGAALGPAGGRAATEGNGRIVIERRRVPPRGSQRVDVELGRDQSRVALEARIDAAGLPLVVVPIEVPPGSDVERARLREERGAAAPTEEVVVRWHRAAPDRLLAVVQRPRAGTFTLGLVVVLPGAAPAAGTLPLARTLLDQAGPSTVTWTAPPATVLELAGADGGGGDPSRPAAASGSIEVPAAAAGPAYRLLEVEADRAGEAPGEAVAETVAAVDPPAAEDGATEPRVELAETHLAIDGRGRAWGVTRLDLVTADPVVRLRMPAGMRPYEVFVDGRVANDALPIRADGGADGAWEVRLLDVHWPRSIALVWAGDLGEGLPVGGTLAVEAPEVVGLPCRQRAWVLELPEGVKAVPLPPALAADDAALRDRRGAAMERLLPGFAAAVTRASPGDAARYEEFVAERRSAVTLPLPAALGQNATRRGERAAAWAPAVTILSPGDDAPQLRVRLSRRPDPSVAGRGWATAALVAGFVALLEARRRTRWFARLTAAVVATWWVGPALVILAGMLWTATLDPAWPGWIALVVGGAALVAWAPRPHGAGGGRPHGPDGAATTHSAPSDSAASGGARREGQAGPSGSTVLRRD